MTFSKTINKWFEKTSGGSLVLPDGWFGRPYDNQHSLTQVEESPSGLCLVLDNNLTLQFVALKNVQVHENDLIFGPFDSLHFEWTPYGSGKAPRQSAKYGPGKVRIVAAPG